MRCKGRLWIIFNGDGEYENIEGTVKLLDWFNSLTL